MEKKFSIGWLRGVDISSIVNEVIETISSLSVFVFVFFFLILFYFITFFFFGREDFATQKHVTSKNQLIKKIKQTKSSKNNNLSHTQNFIRLGKLFILCFLSFKISS